ncbi:hypothetical protein DMUE_2897 [Dictyocoela muelleri]|nr:hypothetical protein DMUE_2897 [Dictyocoela muelleri]
MCITSSNSFEIVLALLLIIRLRLKFLIEITMAQSIHIVSGVSSSIDEGILIIPRREITVSSTSTILLKPPSRMQFRSLIVLNICLNFLRALAIVALLILPIKQDNCEYDKFISKQ